MNRRSALAVVVLLAGVTDGRAQEAAPVAPPEPRRELSIAVVALDGAAPGRRLRSTPAAGEGDAVPPRTGGFRHTFGAERRSAPSATLRAAVSDADIVLVLGVTSPLPVRQRYPARTHVLMVSRALLSDFGTEAATASVAVNRSAGLRTTGLQHFPAPVVDGQRRMLERGLLALRLSHPAGLLWVVAVDASAICAGAAAGCSPQATAAQLADWVKARQSAGESVVISGRLGATTGAAFKDALMGQLGATGVTSLALPPAAACRGSTAADAVLAISDAWTLSTPKAMAETCGVELVLAPK